MLTNAQLATMTVRSVIFHDVPNQRGDGGVAVTLATATTTIDARRRRLLQEKLVKVLDSRSAYGIVFQEQPTSPLPKLIIDLTSQGWDEASFVETSQRFANHLYQVQNSTVSPGLLCVIDITVHGRHGVVLMKLEREAGAQLKMQKVGKQTSFEMAVLDDLVLTSSTKLFKTAAFLRTGPDDDEFEMVACDSQHSSTDTKEMARFWRRYLGCDLEEAARVTTSKFFNASMNFINVYVDDARSFITNHVPEPLKAAFREHLREHHVPQTAFEKDVQDVKSALRKLTYVSAAGVRITTPGEIADLIEVKPEQIVVNDRLSAVGKS